jgi:hypothetical protein
MELSKRVVTASGYVLSTDVMVTCNSASDIVLNLPRAKGGGQFLFIKNIGAGVVSVFAPGLIDEVAEIKLEQYRCIGLIDNTDGVWDVLSGVANKGIFLGSSGTPFPLLTSLTKRAVNIFTTSSSTNGGTSVRPFYFKNTMTGAGGVGGRAEFCMSISNVVLGGWANALKGLAECNTSGRCTGLLSGVCGEVVLPAGNVSALSGNYAAIEAELNAPAGCVPSAATGFLFLGTGGDATAIAALNLAGRLITILGLTAASATHNIFHTTGTVQATHGLRINIDNVDYDILLKASTYA